MAPQIQGPPQIFFGGCRFWVRWLRRVVGTGCPSHDGDGWHFLLRFTGSDRPEVGPCLAGSLHRLEVPVFDADAAVGGAGGEADGVTAFVELDADGLHRSPQSLGVGHGEGGGFLAVDADEHFEVERNRGDIGGEFVFAGGRNLDAVFEQFRLLAEAAVVELVALVPAFEEQDAVARFAW